MKFTIICHLTPEINEMLMQNCTIRCNGALELIGLPIGYSTATDQTGFPTRYSVTIALFYNNGVVMTLIILPRKMYCILIHTRIKSQF